MPLDDLGQYATSDQDFYELLGVTFTTSPSDIRRAYRQTALKYHPDKNGGDPSAIEKFHLLQIAYDVLSDEGVKAAYDAARSARQAKQKQRALFEGKRRQMMDDLERRERGVKRGRDEPDDEVDAEERLRREVARLAEDGRRRRKEREEMLRQEQQKQAEEEEQMAAASLESETVQGSNTTTVPTANQSAQHTSSSPTAAPAECATNVPELDRTIKIRWIVPDDYDPTTTTTASTTTTMFSLPTKESLTKLFTRFGPIANAFLLKAKRQRPQQQQQSKHKRLVATCVLIFESIVGAHAAITDFPAQKGPAWTALDSVSWASGKEPALVGLPNDPDPEPKREDSDTVEVNGGVGSTSRPTTPGVQQPSKGSPSSFSSTQATPHTPVGVSGNARLQADAASAPPLKSNNGSNGGTPSFASFATPTKSGWRASLGGGNSKVGQSPSLEEVTMIRLKKAEKRRLEDEIRKREVEELDAD
ncbi:MAG: hypothetical protein M1825_003414 [Sarcosagium campestre]|nr:MAG: hypothetical protein M1825_003414 [Sarcosagium campestre]